MHLSLCQIHMVASSPPGLVAGSGGVVKAHPGGDAEAVTHAMRHHACVSDARVRVFFVGLSGWRLEIARGPHASGGTVNTHIGGAAFSPGENLVGRRRAEERWSTAPPRRVPWRVRGVCRRGEAGVSE